MLRGSLVRLEPLAPRHAPDLARAAEEDRSSYDFTVVPRAAGAAGYVRTQLARHGLTAFAQVRNADGQAVGCTSYCDPRTWPGGGRLRAVEIGWTWLAASAQNTGINAEAKLLLFTHAFGRWVWPASTSRPMPATSGRAGRSSAPARASRACCAAGRLRGRRARTVRCAIRRCSPWSPASGRP